MKFIKWLVIILIAAPAVLVSGFWIRNKAIGPVGWAMDNTESRLKALMKDPDSMVIRSSYTIVRGTPGQTEEILVCGLVDGKNSFGGYTGGTRFASRSVRNGQYGGTFDTYTVVIEDREVKATADRLGTLSPFVKVYWNDFCVDPAHPPLKPGE